MVTDFIRLWTEVVVLSVFTAFLAGLYVIWKLTLVLGDSGDDSESSLHPNNFCPEHDALCDIKTTTLIVAGISFMCSAFLLMQIPGFVFSKANHQLAVVVSFSVLNANTMIGLLYVYKAAKIKCGPGGRIVNTFFYKWICSINAVCWLMFITERFLSSKGSI